MNTIYPVDETTIRFNPTSYTVYEEDMTATVFVELSGLDTAGSVEVIVSTGNAADSAIGKDVFYEILERLVLNKLQLQLH